jgi:hypothetical protein
MSIFMWFVLGVLAGWIVPFLILLLWAWVDRKNPPDPRDMIG